MDLINEKVEEEIIPTEGENYYQDEPVGIVPNDDYEDIDLIPCLFIEVASKIGAIQILKLIQEEELKKYYVRLQDIIKAYTKEGALND